LRLELIWIVILMMILTGCAPKSAINNHEVVTVQSAKFDNRTYFSDGQTPVPSIDARKRLGTVTIVPAQYAPDMRSNAELTKYALREGLISIEE